MIGGAMIIPTKYKVKKPVSRKIHDIVLMSYFKYWLVNPIKSVIPIIAKIRNGDNTRVNFLSIS